MTPHGLAPTNPADPFIADSNVGRPFLSIVTPSLNQASLLAELMGNVRSQDVASLEHIVIDGASTDGTRDMLLLAGPEVRWVSEADRGQASALNKGFTMARGEVLAWINCDDRYTPGALKFVVEFFKAHPEVKFLFGDALAVDGKGHSYGLSLNPPMSEESRA